MKLWALVVLVASSCVSLVRTDSLTVTPTAMDGEPNELQFLGEKSNVVIATTKYTGSVWRSVDEGKAWTSVTSKLSGKDDEDADDFAGVFAVVPSPSNKATAFVVGMEEECWLTTDSGTTFKSINANFTVRGLKWHPFQDGWALAYKSNI